MSSISLNLPVLVQNEESDNEFVYLIRPLFTLSPFASHRRFDRAVEIFKRELRRNFKGVEFQRENANALLWYMFNPEVRYKAVKMEFSSGKQFVRGRFAVVYFIVQQKCFVLLPGFDNYYFMAKKNAAGKYDVFAQAAEVVEKLIRDLRKSYGVTTLDTDRFMATKGEFVSTVTVNLNIKYAGFSFEQNAASWFFTSMQGQSDFAGDVELEKVGYNINDLYPGSLSRAFYREELVQRLYDIIYHVENSPIVLLGEEGVGKKSILHEVVYRYRKANEGKQYGALEHTWMVDPTRIISGMSIVGMWQKRFEAILHHLIKRREKNGRHTDKMVIENIIAMLRIGKSSQNDMTLSDVLKPYLERRSFQMILVATPQEWKVLQEKDRRFADLFQVIRVREPDRATAVRMILEQRKILERDNECVISNQAISQLFTIQRNYLKRKALPGSITKLLKQISVKYRFGTIDIDEVQREFRLYSGLNEAIFDPSYTFEEEEVYTAIDSKLIGQPAAVKTLSEVIHLIKAKLNNPERPLGSFLFIGPTGVGKTQAAKELCNYLMGDEERLMRFDMNEYIDEYAIQRLIGDYYHPEGQLTGKVRYNPFGILLLDEIEKAHPKVHDLLLQVLDDGRLTDSMGRTVDFSNTIIIMTSNVGAREVSSQLGFETAAKNDSAVYAKAVENHFRPEFINRIDQIVIFDPLELDHIMNIAKLQIKELLSRDGFVRRTTILNISQEALEWVARRGFDARMGGRALKRQIEKDLTVLSAEQLVKTFVDKPILFDIELEDGKLVPRIEELSFVKPLPEKWLPKIPAENEVKGYYRSLLGEVEKIERSTERVSRNDDSIISFGDGNDPDWQYYDFTNKVTELKEHLKTRILGFGSKYYEAITGGVLRLKGTGTASLIYKNRGDKKQRDLLKEKLFHEDALDELRHVYQNAPMQFDKLQSEYINEFLNVAFLLVAAKGFEAQKTDKITISFQSAIQGMGDEEINYLKSKYLALFEDMDVQFQKQDFSLTAEGHSLFALLKGENGIHLFYQSHLNPVPIKVKVTMDGTKLPHQSLKVIRMYDIWHKDINKASTLTDLRTGYTNFASINPQEFKFLLYGGLAKKDRLTT